MKSWNSKVRRTKRCKGPRRYLFTIQFDGPADVSELWTGEDVREWTFIDLLTWTKSKAWDQRFRMSVWAHDTCVSLLISLMSPVLLLGFRLDGCRICLYQCLQSVPFFREEQEKNPTESRRGLEREVPFRNSFWLRFCPAGTERNPESSSWRHYRELGGVLNDNDSAWFRQGRNEHNKIRSQLPPDHIPLPPSLRPTPPLIWLGLNVLCEITSL